jgi:hypothetical protein
MDFRELNVRFVEHLQTRIRRGEVTERSLARLVGISQPHLHHVLKGKRELSPAMADQILLRLKMDLLDLIDPSDLPKWPHHH